MKHVHECHSFQLYLNCLCLVVMPIMSLVGILLGVNAKFIPCLNKLISLLFNVRLEVLITQRFFNYFSSLPDSMFLVNFLLCLLITLSFSCKHCRAIASRNIPIACSSKICSICSFSLTDSVTILRRLLWQFPISTRK